MILIIHAHPYPSRSRATHALLSAAMTLPEVTVHSLYERYPDFERLTKSFENAGINSRFSAVPFEWFEKPQDWPSRTAAYLAGATDMFIGAGTKALAAAGWTAEEYKRRKAACVD